MAAAIGLKAWQVVAVAAVATLALSVAGCGNAELTPPSLATGTVSSEAGASVATPDRMEGNPFHDASAQALAGRQVIANPSLAEIMQPVGGLPEMSLGRADAPVTIIKYASMTCPYCRLFQIDVFPELKRQYIDTGKVRLIIREFPIGFQSGSATIAMRCVAEAKRFDVYDKLMRQQVAWVSQEVRTDPILKVAAQSGLTREQFDACRQNQALVKDLAAIKERGRALGIVGTPNFFINRRLIKSTLALKDVKAIIDPLLAGGGAAPAVAPKS